MIWFKTPTKQYPYQRLYLPNYSHQSHPILIILFLVFLVLLYICKESSTVSNQRKFPGTIASWPIGRSDAENESRPHSEFGGRLQSIPVVCSFLLPSHCSHTLLCPLTLPLTLIVHQDVRASGFQVRSAFQAGKEPLLSCSFLWLSDPDVPETMPDEDLGNRAEHHHRACASTLRRPPRASL